MTPFTKEQQHKQALLRFVTECVNTGNFDTIGQTFAPDHIMHSPSGDMDRAGVAAFLTALRIAMPDFRMTIDTLLVEGDTAATRRHFQGTFTHEMPSPNGMLPPTGKPVFVELINTFRFNADGFVVEEWTQFDNLSLLVQLGVMPAPGQ